MKDKLAELGKGLDLVKAPRGCYWHVWHNCWWAQYGPGIQFRIGKIKIWKPECEIPIRLKWMTKVKGKIPRGTSDYCSSSLSLPQGKYAEALHAKEHPGCPFNGWTLFPS